MATSKHPRPGHPIIGQSRGSTSRASSRRSRCSGVRRVGGRRVRFALGDRVGGADGRRGVRRLGRRRRVRRRRPRRRPVRRRRRARAGVRTRLARAARVRRRRRGEPPDAVRVRRGGRAVSVLAGGIRGRERIIRIRTRRRRVPRVETRAPAAGSHVGQPARRGCGGPAEAGHGVTRRAVATDARPRRPRAPRRRPASDSNGPRRFRSNRFVGELVGGPRARDARCGRLP
mmetsp:Transcript_4537/g.18666  ORF Transcript_4537/g.18666 Transcript_4537/m.18666 type:complete len:230 (+) Transcript_4537:754-1443(+)